MTFLVLGATGMAGHVISLFLMEQGHDVTAFSRRPFPYVRNIVGDARDFKLLEDTIKSNEYDVVVNCIGILNSDAENNKHDAVFLNSLLPHYLSNLTREMNTRVFHMSTDCVFSGKSGGYSERSFKDGETFYDRSKALGELDNNKDLTFRNSIIGPDISQDGIGLFNWFMKQHGEVRGFIKAIWTGVTTLTLAKAMEQAAKCNLVGLYNLVNNGAINKYEMLKLFNRYFKDDQLTVYQNEDVIVDKSLINNRTDFDFIVPSYEEMIKEMHSWVFNHRELYPHYFKR